MIVASISRTSDCASSSFGSASCAFRAHYNAYLSLSPSAKIAAFALYKVAIVLPFTLLLLSASSTGGFVSSGSKYASAAASLSDYAIKKAFSRINEARGCASIARSSNARSSVAPSILLSLCIYLTQSICFSIASMYFGDFANASWYAWCAASQSLSAI